MKLQMAWNPRKKKVAKKRKKRKTKGVKAKFNKGKFKMAKKRRVRKFGRRRVRKNPEAAVIRKNGKIIGREFSPLSRSEADALKGKIQAAVKRYNQAESASPQRSAALKELIVLKKEANQKLGKRDSYLKTLERYIQDGAKVSKFDFKKKGAAVAKKRKKKKGLKRKAKKAAKKLAAKKVARKARKSKRKTRKSRKMSKAAKRAFVARMKKARKSKGGSKRKSRRGKKRSRPRMISHRHAASTRHIKKGTTFRFSTKAKRGKRKITVSGKVKFNPFRSNPMKNLSAQSKKFLGLDGSEIAALAVGGAAVPVVNAAISKIPGADKVVAKINEFVGPQATGAVIPILAGIALNLIGDKASGDVKSYLKLAGEGLAAAGVVSLAAGLSQTYVAPALGLSGMGIMPTLNGINYTPRGMRGINFTPKGMRGINFTPNMGEMPRLTGSRQADFGSADYGGGGGSPEARTSRADFGAWDSQDSEAFADMEDADNSYSSSMN